MIKHLEYKQDFKQALNRVYSWYNGEETDRPLIRFSEHNAMQNESVACKVKQYNSTKDYWYDTNYHINSFIGDVEGNPPLAETFPVYYPNLGPGVYAGFYGSKLEFGEVTSWTDHFISDIETYDFSKIKFDENNEYFKKIDEMTNEAIKLSKDKFLVGYTDLHPSVDCVVDWVGPEKLCMALYDAKECVKSLTEIAYRDFNKIYDYFYNKITSSGGMSVSWMGIPTYEKMHIPSCDFSSLISKKQFEEFCLPYILKEIAHAKYNIFHLDGRGVAKHIDMLLEIKELQAIQLVQGVAEDEPIMQWIPLIKKIQSANKGVVVSIKLEELEEFIKAVDKKGVYLTLTAEYNIQKDIIKRVEQW